jgi:hypothetical protein
MTSLVRGMISVLCLLCLSIASADAGEALDRGSVLPRMGWSAAQLAASGFSPQDVQMITGRVAASPELCAQWELQRRTAQAALREVGDIRRRLARDPGNVGLGELLVSTRSRAVQLAAEARATRGQLQDVLLGGFGAKAQVLTVTQRASGDRAPVEFMVVSRSDEEWSHLVRALTAETRAHRAGGAHAAPV